MAAFDAKLNQRQLLMNRKIRRLVAPVLMAALPFSGCALLSMKPSTMLPSWIETSGRVDAKIAYARLCERHGQTKQAQELYHMLCKSRIVSAKQSAYHRLGVMAGKRGDFIVARDHFKQAAELGSTSAELLNDMGYNYYLMDELVEAETCFRESIKKDPDYKAAQNNLGLALGQQGKFEESYAVFSRVGNEAQAHANMAYVYAQHRHLDQAKAHYLKALGHDGGNKAAAEGLLQVAGAVDRAKQAIDEANTVVAVSHETPAASAATAPVEKPLVVATPEQALAGISNVMPPKIVTPAAPSAAPANPPQGSAQPQTQAPVVAHTLKTPPAASYPAQASTRGNARKESSQQLISRARGISTQSPQTFEEQTSSGSSTPASSPSSAPKAGWSMQSMLQGSNSWLNRNAPNTAQPPQVAVQTPDAPTAVASPYGNNNLQGYNNADERLQKRLTAQSAAPASVQTPVAEAPVATLPTVTAQPTVAAAPQAPLPTAQESQVVAPKQGLLGNFMRSATPPVASGLANVSVPETQPAANGSSRRTSPTTATIPATPWSPSTNDVVARPASFDSQPTAARTATPIATRPEVSATQNSLPSVVNSPAVRNMVTSAPSATLPTAVAATPAQVAAPVTISNPLANQVPVITSPQVSVAPPTTVLAPTTVAPTTIANPVAPVSHSFKASESTRELNRATPIETNIVPLPSSPITLPNSPGKLPQLPTPKPSAPLSNYRNESPNYSFGANQRMPTAPSFATSNPAVAHLAPTAEATVRPSMPLVNMPRPIGNAQNDSLSALSPNPMNAVSTSGLSSAASAPAPATPVTLPTNVVPKSYSPAGISPTGVNVTTPSLPQLDTSGTSQSTANPQGPRDQTSQRFAAMKTSRPGETKPATPAAETTPAAKTSTLPANLATPNVTPPNLAVKPIELEIVGKPRTGATTTPVTPKPLTDRSSYKTPEFDRPTNTTPYGNESFKSLGLGLDGKAQAAKLPAGS